MRAARIRNCRLEPARGVFRASIAFAHSHRKAIFLAGAGGKQSRSWRAAAFRSRCASSHAKRTGRPEVGLDAAALPPAPGREGRRGWERAGNDLELGQRLHLAQSTVTELVNRAAQAGLVRRGTSPDDGRVVYVQLTEEGDRRFAEAFRALAHERRALHDVVTKLDV